MSVGQVPGRFLTLRLPPASQLFESQPAWRLASCCSASSRIPARTASVCAVGRPGIRPASLLHQEAARVLGNGRRRPPPSAPRGRLPRQSRPETFSRARPCKFRTSKQPSCSAVACLDPFHAASRRTAQACPRRRHGNADTVMDYILRSFQYPALPVLSKSPLPGLKNVDANSRFCIQETNTLRTHQRHWFICFSV